MAEIIAIIIAILTSGCGPKGDKGPNGGQGAVGPGGSNSIPCSISSVPASGLPGALDQYGGALVTCVNGSNFISNGATGVSGQAGLNGSNGANGGTVTFNLVQVIQPCGTASSPYKEVILGLAGGQLLSSFSENNNGLNTRFSFIPNGTYQDTDSSGCSFTVSGDGLTTSTINWNAGLNGYSNWPAGGFHWTQPLGWVAI